MDALLVLGSAYPFQHYDNKNYSLFINDLRASLFYSSAEPLQNVKRITRFQEIRFDHLLGNWQFIECYYDCWAVAFKRERLDH